MPLTPTARRLICAIGRYQAEQGRAPTYRQIAAVMRWSQNCGGWTGYASTIRPFLALGLGPLGHGLKGATLRLAPDVAWGTVNGQPWVGRWVDI